MQIYYYFYVLPYMISLLFAACESTTVLYIMLRIRGYVVISHLSFILELESSCFTVVCPGRFIPSTHCILASVG